MSEAAHNEAKLEEFAQLVEEGLALEEKGWRQSCEYLWKIRQEFIGKDRPINPRRADGWKQYAASRFPDMGESGLRHRVNAWETIENLSDPAGSDAAKAEVIEIAGRLPQESLRSMARTSRERPEEVRKAFSEALQAAGDDDTPTHAEVQHFVRKHLPDLSKTHLRMPIRRLVDEINDFELTAKDYAKVVEDDPVTIQKLKEGLPHAIRYLTDVEREITKRYG